VTRDRHSDDGSVVGSCHAGTITAPSASRRRQAGIWRNIRIELNAGFAVWQSTDPGINARRERTAIWMAPNLAGRELLIGRVIALGAPCPIERSIRGRSFLRRALRVAHHRRTAYLGSVRQTRGRRCQRHGITWGYEPGSGGRASGRARSLGRASVLGWLGRARRPAGGVGGPWSRENGGVTRAERLAPPSLCARGVSSRAR
jgi:hypothetical protein